MLICSGLYVLMTVPFLNPFSTLGYWTKVLRLWSDEVMEILCAAWRETWRARSGDQHHAALFLGALVSLALHGINKTPAGVSSGGRMVLLWDLTDLRGLIQRQVSLHAEESAVVRKMLRVGSGGQSEVRREVAAPRPSLQVRALADTIDPCRVALPSEAGAAFCWCNLEDLEFICGVQRIRASEVFVEVGRAIPVGVTSSGERDEFWCALVPSAGQRGHLVFPCIRDAVGVSVRAANAVRLEPSGAEADPAGGAAPGVA